MADLGFGSMRSPTLSVETKPADSLQAMFIKFDGINGESFDANHKDWIDVLSFSYAVAQSTSTASGGGSGVGKANFGNFMFTHYNDTASPNMMKYCAEGKPIPKVVFSATKAGPGNPEYMKITFNEVFITAINDIGATNSPRSLEEISFSYAKIEMEVKKQNADNTMGAAVTGAYNVKENKLA